MVLERLKVGGQAAHEIFARLCGGAGEVQDYFADALSEALPEDIDDDTKRTLASASSFLSIMTTLAFSIRQVWLWEGY